MRLGILLACMSGMGLVVNFASQWLIVTQLGVGPATDALFAGMSIPMIILSVLAASITNVLVPMLAPLEKTEFDQLFWSIFSFSTFAALVVVVVGSATAGRWAGWIFPGFSSSDIGILVSMVRIQLFVVPLTIGSTLLWSAFNARGRFYLVEASGLAASVLSTSLLVLCLPKWGIEAAAWISLIRPGAQIVMLSPFLGGFCLPRFGSGLKLAWKRVRNLLAGSLVTKSEPLIDRFFSSFGSRGDLTHLHLASQIYGSGHMILSRAISAPAVTRLSILAANRDWARFGAESRRSVTKCGSIAILVTLAISSAFLGIEFFDPSIGRFSSQDFNGLFVCLLGLTGFWVAGSMGQILAASFYALGDTRTPTWISLVGFGVAVILKLVLFSKLGVLGVTLGASAGSLVAVLLYMQLFSRRLASSAFTRA